MSTFQLHCWCGKPMKGDRVVTYPTQAELETPDWEDFTGYYGVSTGCCSMLEGELDYPDAQLQALHSTRELLGHARQLLLDDLVALNRASAAIQQRLMPGAVQGTTLRPGAVQGTTLAALQCYIRLAEEKLEALEARIEEIADDESSTYAEETHRVRSPPVSRAVLAHKAAIIKAGAR